MNAWRSLNSSRSCVLTLGFTTVLVTACSTQRVQQKLDPAERAVQPTVSAFECGGGSVRAAIASCRAEGGHYGHCALVASRAGVTGATSCYTYANQVRKHRAQLIGQEDQLDAQTHYLQDLNMETAKLNDELTSRAEDAKARADIASDSLAQGQMTASELNQLRAILDVEVSSAQRQLDAASQELQAAERYRGQQPSPVAALDAQIARLQSLLEETQRDTSALVAQRQRL